MKIKVEEAQITTVSVEIRTLVVGGKQVTLAVFRQLWEVPLFDDDGVMTGQPWGVVNYHPEKTLNPEGHLHVVFQQDGELRRARVGCPRHAPLDDVSLWEGGLAYCWLPAALLDGWTFPAGGGTDWSTSSYGAHSLRVGFQDSLPAASFSCGGSGDVQAVHRYHLPWGKDAWSASEKEKTEKELRTFLAKYAPNRSRSDLVDVMIKHLTRVRDTRQRLVDGWGLLSALPQLFIAV